MSGRNSEQPPVRVRITGGPAQEAIGRIGYLFEFALDGASEESYILTVLGERVERLAIRDGYTFVAAEEQGSRF